MTVVLKILAAILIFGLLIFVHELGHFLVAKWMGIRVNEFALGMGPRLLKFGKKETVYSLRLFPIGGFCAMEGEDADSEDPRAFGNRPVWRRILVVVAGVCMNFLLGYLLLLIALGVCIQPENGSEKAVYNSTTVATLAEQTLPYQTGLRPGDRIVRANGKRIVTDIDLAMILQSDEDGVLDMTVVRDVDGVSQKVVLSDVTFPLVTAEDGTRYLSYEFRVMPVEKTVWSTVARAGKLEWSYATLVWRSLGDLISGKYGLNELSGPVGTADIIGDAVQDAVQSASLNGLYSLLMIVVLITVNLGVFNLLPLPALDGGRLVFLLWEVIFRRPIPAKYEGLVHTIGFILIILFSVVVLFSDIRKLIAGA